MVVGKDVTLRVVFLLGGVENPPGWKSPKKREKIIHSLPRSDREKKCPKLGLSLLCLAVLLASAFGSPMTQGPCRAEMSHVRLTAALHMMDAI